ncbi:dehydrogenase/reductase SDR family member 4-like [Haliotis asinina]|uniref:dehydrogenase/reductase SDR family member 4-like n=1 Tax=Haliotis asinina TaxID=109174 RepID=UPI0035320425
MALCGKIAIITGSSSGIGAGIAVAFAKEGAKLSLTGRNQKNLEEVVKDCKKAGCQDVLTNVGDITQDDFRRTLVDTTKKKFGKIDILVNNAGIGGMNQLTSLTKEEYDKLMAVNVEAPLFLTQLAAPHLIETKGNVVNNSSCVTSMTVLFICDEFLIDMLVHCPKCWLH